ncbi:MAG: hypothetical protein JXB36_01935 [Gammaproteobacteria bacterium]|nr:hypothetical protein [Gammaproteobacteria bacterium]
MYPSAGGDGACGVERLDIEGRAYIRYSRYLKINPNDAQANRGAYLSAGFLAGRVLTTHEAASCIDVVAQICGQLRGLVGADNRVAPEFELTQYAFGRQRPEGLLDDGCSPLLQLDVLLQALHAEGPSSFRPGRPIFLGPAARAGAGETDRRLFYFASGTAGSQLQLEREREKLKRLTEKLVIAVSHADQVQDEWLSYQAMISEYLPAVATRGSELRMLIDEVERLSGALDEIGATAAGAPAGEAARRAASSGVRPYVGPVPTRYRSAGAPARRAERGRRSRFPSQGLLGRNSRPRLRIAVGVGGAVAVAAAVTLAVQLLSSRPESAPGEDSAAGPAGPAERLQGPVHPVPHSAERVTGTEGPADVAVDTAVGAMQPAAGVTQPTVGALDSGAGATDPEAAGPTHPAGAADRAAGAAVVEDGATVSAGSAVSPAARPARTAVSGAVEPVRPDREDARSDVVRERAALGQRAP